METDPQILVVGPDRKLLTELASAAACLPGLRPIVSYQSEYRAGLEAARSRHPQVVLVEMDKDIATLKHFVEEVGFASPDTAVVAVFYENVFGVDVSESEVLIAALRAGIRDFLRRPLAPEDLGQLLSRLGRFSAPRARDVGKIVTFMSNKGGVGKSTLSINVAAKLARRNRGKVLLIDASLQMGDCANMLDLHPTTTLTDVCRQRDRLDERLIRELTIAHSSGLHLLSCPNDPTEASEIDDEVISRVLQLARRTYDFVVVDSFPMVDRLMTAVLDLTDTIYIVTENTVPIVRGTAKTLHLLDQLGFPAERRRIILNRYSSSHGNLKPADVAARCGCKLDYVIPFDKKLMVAANLGRPHILHAGLFSSFRRAMKPLVVEVGEKRAALNPAAPLPGRTHSGAEINATGEDAVAIDEQIEYPQGSVSSSIERHSQSDFGLDSSQRVIRPPAKETAPRRSPSTPPPFVSLTRGVMRDSSEGRNGGNDALDRNDATPSATHRSPSSRPPGSNGHATHLRMTDLGTHRRAAALTLTRAGTQDDAESQIGDNGDSNVAVLDEMISERPSHFPVLERPETESTAIARSVAPARPDIPPINGHRVRLPSLEYQIIVLNCPQEQGAGA